VLVVFDPKAFGGPGFATRMEGLLTAFKSDVGVRLPGDRRLASRAKTRQGGIALAAELHAQIAQLVG
jgi:(2R)-3-sulfolactate dehydrogenase (NADP+)